jgi:hypothetical protein
MTYWLRSQRFLFFRGKSTPLVRFQLSKIPRGTDPLSANRRIVSLLLYEDEGGAACTGAVLSTRTLVSFLSVLNTW